MPSAAIHNLGCKVNACEADAMRHMLIEAGYTIVPFTEKADVYLINTCTVTNVADKKSRQMIHRARKQNPDALIVAAGCYVQVKNGEEPYADIVLGNNRKSELIPLLARAQKERECLREWTDVNDGILPFEELAVTDPDVRTRAFVKIQDGCNQFCSYCIVPYARGRVRSRSSRQILAECSQLAKAGFRELVMTGIHISSYGIDTGESLLDLLKEISRIPEVMRIRLGSLEPGIITDAFVKELAGLSKVCPHFHLSLQSGSASVLKRMNRHYSPDEYLDKCRILRTYYKDPTLTTDIIVGFPGETPEEFEESLAFAKKIGFYEIHVFKYSRREGTKAASMSGQITEAVKKERSHILMEEAEKLKRSYEERFLGKRLPVLFEDSSVVDGRTVWEGFSAEYLKVYFASEEDLHNQIMDVEFSRGLY